MTAPLRGILPNMAEDEKPGAIALLPGAEDSAKTRAPYRDWTDEDKYTALAALDINAGNVYRTAIAYGIPESTLRTWRDERAARGGGPSKLEREKRGNLRAKMESALHSLVESIPAKISKATLSQAAVATGILTDKIRLLRSTEDDNPTIELCRILGCSPDELPPSLQISDPEPPDPSIIETQANPNNPDSYEPALVVQHDPCDDGLCLLTACPRCNPSAQPSPHGDYIIAEDSRLINDLDDDEKPS